MKLINIYVTKGNKFIACNYIAENEIETYKIWLEHWGADTSKYKYLIRPQMNETIDEKGHGTIRAFIDGKFKRVKIK